MDLKIMNKRLYPAILLTILMTLSIILTPASAQNGARSQELWIIPYANPDAVYAALKLPSSDPDALEIMNWPLTGTQYEDAISDDDIQLARTVESGMREFDINNNETCKVYPGVPSPTGYPDFRKALAHLTDKDYITEVICEGFSARLDIPIPYSAVGWWNPDVTGANYPYPYDPCAADLLLDAMGFVEGTTPNPYHDPSWSPCSASNIRVYPNWYWYHENPHESKCDPDHDHEQPYMWTLEKAVTGTIKVFADPACPYTNCLYPEYDPPDPPEDCCEYRELALGWEYTYDAPSNTVTVWINLKICSKIVIWYQTTNPYAGQDIHPLVFYARSDDPLRYAAAVHLKDNMLKMGIPVDFRPGDSSYCYPPVMGALEYHLYTGGWGLGRYPTYLYYLYHTDFYLPWWYNYINPHCYRPLEDAISLDPRSDQKVAAIYYTETLETAKAATIAWQAVFMENCINIPLWSQVSYYAYKNLLGIVNMAGVGPENEYCFMNMYRADDPTKPVRMGNNQPPKSLSMLESEWTYEYSILDRMQTGGIMTNPYDRAIDQPWIVQDWHSSKWYDAEDDMNKTKTTYWLRKDVMYHTPVTGAPYRGLTAQDCVFTASETQAFPGCWPYSGYNDVHHILVVDDYCFEVYYNDASYWFTYAADGYPYLPKDIYLDSAVNDYFTETFVVGTNFTDSADMVMTEWPVVLGYDYKWCNVSLTKDATDYTIELFADSTVKVTEDGSVTWKDCWPLEDPDKQLNPNTAIRTDSGFKPWLNFTYLAGLTLADDDSFTVSYYGGVDDTGLTPGNEPWQTIFTAAGIWYMKEMPDISGPFVFGKCSQFFMETAPLGEVDWRWNWDVEDDTRRYNQTVPSGPCTTRWELVAPRTGYFKIDVYDVATVLGAYWSTGDLIPDPHWFPGADLELPECKIDMYDVVTVTGNYEVKFGHPPLDP